MRRAPQPLPPDSPVRDLLAVGMSIAVILYVYFMARA